MNDATTVIDNEVALATTAELASIFGCSDRAIRALQERGTIHAASPGMYPRDAAIHDYIAHLRAVASGREGITGSRQRLVDAQAAKLEHQNRVARGEFLHVAEVVSAWSQAIQHARGKLLALPNALAPRLADRPVFEVQSALREAIYEVLEELAATEFAPNPDVADDAGARNTEPQSNAGGGDDEI